MLPSVADPYDMPPAWWEADYVRYGLSYIPVRSRLMAVMGSPIVRLTDRKYMIQLASKLQEYHEMQQKARIEKQKLKSTSIVPELCKLSESLLKKISRRSSHRCASKFYAEATKKCKQLPQLILAENS